MSHLIDLTGQKFGRLTVIKKAERKKGCTNALWLCLCDCGRLTIVRSTSLRKGESQSCGCYRSEYWKGKMTSHGKSTSSIAHTWYEMKARCMRASHHAFKNYGGRGIKVCDEWQNDFQAFYDHVSALPHFGEEGYSLDRINNNSNYEPGNVRWATAKEQANNRRNNRCNGIRIREI